MMLMTDDYKLDYSCVWWEGGLASLALLVVGAGDERRRIYRGALSTARIPNPHSHLILHQHQHLQFISSSIQSRTSLALISLLILASTQFSSYNFLFNTFDFLAFAQSSI
jgi:hypothetical protein